VNDMKLRPIQKFNIILGFIVLILYNFFIISLISIDAVLTIITIISCVAILYVLMIFYRYYKIIIKDDENE